MTKHPTLECFGLSDPGKVRSRNEDQFLAARLQKVMTVEQTSLSHEERSRLTAATQGHIFVVADGMGGQNAGDLASRIAVGTLIRYLLNTMNWFFRLAREHQADLADELARALRACQRGIETEVGRHPEEEGMGTTLTLSYVIWPRMYVVHAGDSRCYLFRSGALSRITRDHTVDQRLIDRGVLPPGTRTHQAHVLWNAVGGGSPSLEPEVSRVELQEGDVVLLCTDGLSHQVPDPEIARILCEHPAPEPACRALVGAANAAGGKDNVTVVVTRAPGETEDR